MFNTFYRSRLSLYSVSSKDDAWKKATEIIQPAIAQKHYEAFEKEYADQTKHIPILKERYEFYVDILANTEATKQYREELGEDDLQERVAYALHKVVSHGDEIKNAITDLAKNFILYCRDKENEIDIYDFINNAKVDIETVEQPKVTSPYVLEKYYKRYERTVHKNIEKPYKNMTEFDHTLVDNSQVREQQGIQTARNIVFGEAERLDKNT